MSLTPVAPNKKNSGFLKSYITLPNLTKSGTYENPNPLPYFLPEIFSTKLINFLIVPGITVDDRTIK